MHELDGHEIFKTFLAVATRQSFWILPSGHGRNPAALKTIVRYPEEICLRSPRPIVPTQF
jgi:hypothetical protein